MNTPICDFVREYAAKDPLRLHMPGHKGAALLGCEALDLTEIGGADSLYAPRGIIRESEKNAAALFGAGDTLYSAEGSSQCIRAMVYLARLAWSSRRGGGRPLVIAGRNAHKAFLSAAALLDVDIAWLFPEDPDYSLCRCLISPEALESALREHPHAAAVYLTSPDYLGNQADLPPLAAIAHQWGVPLLVDNAHGAYLAFLEPSRHPLALGADLCCDSAHKTLPVLTGGAYLHLGPGAPGLFSAHAREAMALFGSTSPSYLILQSLDRANLALSEGYAQKLRDMAEALEELKARLAQKGWGLIRGEPLKLTLDAKSRGYSGGELGGLLEALGIVPEYADPDWLVLMPGPENPPGALERLEAALSALERRKPLADRPPVLRRPQAVLTVREALLSPKRRVRLSGARGEILASLAVSCPPAVAPAVPGERLGENALAIYRYYGVEEVWVTGPGSRIPS